MWPVGVSEKEMLDIIDYCLGKVNNHFRDDLGGEYADLKLQQEWSESKTSDITGLQDFRRDKAECSLNGEKLPVLQVETHRLRSLQSISQEPSGSELRMHSRMMLTLIRSRDEAFPLRNLRREHFCSGAIGLEVRYQIQSI